MNPELDQKLVEAFPNLYRDRTKGPKETCMCWGFPGDGWFQILWDLSQKLEKLILELPEDERSFCRAAQVKEKFGTLRFNMTTWAPGMEEAIREAEEKSSKTCEQCGNPGEARRGGWIKVLCEEHFQGKD